MTYSNECYLFLQLWGGGSCLAALLLVSVKNQSGEVKSLLERACNSTFFLLNTFYFANGLIIFWFCERGIFIYVCFDGWYLQFDFVTICDSNRVNQ